MVSDCPVETVSGSEVRALAWIESARPKNGAHIWVLTYVSAGRFVVAHFVMGSDAKPKLLSEKVETGLEAAGEGEHFFLTDGRIPESLLAAVAPAVFELKAHYLATQLASAVTRKTYRTLAEWIALSPEYFGSQHYD